MHLLNKQKTAIRKVEKKWNVLGSLRRRDLQKQVADSIEFDKSLFVQKLDLQDRKVFQKSEKSQNDPKLPDHDVSRRQIVFFRCR